MKSIYSILPLAMMTACGVNPQKSKEVKAPNVIYIMADDHATAAISAYGSRLSSVLKTPSLDRLAKEGAILRNCFATNSICTPSRASILTGQHSHLNGVRTLTDTLDIAKPTLIKELNKGGYQTALVGKWHLHSEPQYFDYYEVLPGQGRYFDPEYKKKGENMNLPFEKRPTTVHKGYSTDVTTELSIKWLEQRDKNKPFFLMTNFKAPHMLWQYHPKYEHLLDSVDIPEPENLFPDKSNYSSARKGHENTLIRLANLMSGKTPYHDDDGNFESWPTGNLKIDGLSKKEMIKAGYQKYLKDYLRVVASIDENVGKLLDYLERNGLAENTIVVYTSDQGMFLGEHQYLDKRWIFEESIKMPFLIRYPKAISVGLKVDELITNVDFAPTLLDYAGVDKPDYMQGESFKSILEGNTPNNWQSSIYYRYWMHRDMTPAHYGIRTDRYKLVYIYGLNLDANNYGHPDSESGWEFYDLKKDPHENINLYEAHEYQRVIDSLKQELQILKTKFNDPDSKYPEMMKQLTMNIKQTIIN